jgi:hypothetical protein
VRFFSTFFFSSKASLFFLISIYFPLGNNRSISLFLFDLFLYEDFLKDDILASVETGDY